MSNDSISRSRRHPWGVTLRSLVIAAVAVLLAKVFLATVYEYRYYFPANFDSAFLGGRRFTFTGIYPFAFYAHILVGPVTILLGVFLLMSGGGRGWKQWHRRAGWLQAMHITTGQ